MPYTRDLWTYQQSASSIFEKIFLPGASTSQSGIYRCTAEGYQLGQLFGDLLARLRAVGIHAQTLSGVLIDYRQNSKPSSVRQAFAHKVHAPTLVRKSGFWVFLPVSQGGRTGYFAMRRRKTSKIPVTNIAGVGGQPGIYPSTGMTASTAPTTAWLPAKMPPLHPQAPTATRGWGDGPASYVILTASAILRVTGPVTKSMSACLGEATK